MTQQPRPGVVSRIWETNLLAPSVAVLRGFFTLALIGAVVMVFLAVHEADWEALAIAGGLVAVIGILIVYAASMAIPDLVALIMHLDRDSRTKLPELGHGCRRYLILFLVSDFLRISALAVVIGLVVRFLRGLMPRLFALPMTDVAGWWWVGSSLAALGVAVFSGWQVVRLSRAGAVRVGVAGWLAGLLGSVMVFQYLAAGRYAMLGGAVVLLLGCGVVAGFRAWEAYRKLDWTALVGWAAAGGAVVVLGLVRIADLRYLPASIAGLTTPWVDRLAGDAAEWSAVGGVLIGGARTAGLSTRYEPAFALVALLAAISAYFLWVKSDLARALARFGERLVALAPQFPDRPFHLKVFRFLLVPALVGCVVLPILMAIGAASLRGDLAPIAAALGGTPPSVMVSVLLWILGIAGLVEVFQIAADVSRTDAMAEEQGFLDFRWLKAFVGLVYVFIAALTIGIVVLAIGFLAEFGNRPEILIPGLVVGLPLVLLIWAYQVSIPAFLGHLIGAEARLRPAGESRVHGSPRYPGITFFMGVGRVVAWLATLGVVIGTVIAAIPGFAYFEREPAVLLFTVAAGVVAAVVVCIAFGAGPDFLSLLLTIARNVRELDGALGTDAGPGVGDALRQRILHDLPAALDTLGVGVVGAPVVPPGDSGCLAECRGRQGIYRVQQAGSSLLLMDPNGNPIGEFSSNGFAPRPGAFGDGEHWRGSHSDGGVPKVTPIVPVLPLDLHHQQPEAADDGSRTRQERMEPPTQRAHATEAFDASTDVTGRHTEVLDPTPIEMVEDEPTAAPPIPVPPPRVEHRQHEDAERVESGHGRPPAWDQVRTQRFTDRSSGADLTFQLAGVDRPEVLASAIEYVAMARIGSRFAQAQWTSRIDGRSLVFRVSGSAGSEMLAALRASADKIRSFASNMAMSVSPITSFPESQVQLADDRRSPVFAPGWCRASGAPGFTKIMDASRGRKLAPNRRLKSFSGLLVVRDGNEITLYGAPLDG
jgi:hypothetical protein